MYKRQVLKDCMEFSRILSLGQPEEDMKKENRQPVKHRTNGLKPVSYTHLDVYKRQEFKSLKNIETSFRQIRLFSLVFLASCTLLTVFSVWKSYAAE